eukprot:2616310-Pleurochrysis_carterae.AAC.2
MNKLAFTCVLDTPSMSALIEIRRASNARKEQAIRHLNAAVGTVTHRDVRQRARMPFVALAKGFLQQITR